MENDDQYKIDKIISLMYYLKIDQFKNSDGSFYIKDNKLLDSDIHQPISKENGFYYNSIIIDLEKECCKEAFRRLLIKKLPFDFNESSVYNYVENLVAESDVPRIVKESIKQSFR